MKILVIGGGGREHALLWAFHREEPSAQLFCAPGNAGTARLATNLPIPAHDIARLVGAVAEHAVDLTVVGPEVPLALGVVDRLRTEGRPVFGPSAAAARIEASKTFAKEVMQRAGVPTAASRSFRYLEEARTWIDRHPEPLVVKASGLAAGKGAVVCQSRVEATRAAAAMLGGAMGDAGQEIVVEEFMEGEELSVFALTDGQDHVLLPAAQDHKRLEEGDRGPNTGGMGAYSPVSIATPALLDRVQREVIQPTLAQMARDGCPFAGVLYAGLMIGARDSIRVVEFNCRLGDPEAQVVLPLVRGGLLQAVTAIAHGRAPAPLTSQAGAAVTTVLAARGYPAKPEKGAVITLPDELPPGLLAFHAGTTRDAAGVLRVSGGRVLAVTGTGATFVQAQERSREGAAAVEFEGKVFRRDIGWREARRVL